MQVRKGSLHLFRLFGVNVFVHWSWAIVAVIQIMRTRNAEIVGNTPPHSLGFYIAQYLCLFLIVLIHEFGHALACKSVGGLADRIVLWPLGGVAFVQPPPRPGALLWSIAAGPLVNVALLPVTIIPAVLVNGFAHHPSPMGAFLAQLAIVNFILLVFNMLPIYPLDGGQIFRALAWFIFGRGTSLVIAAVVGLIGAAALMLLALLTGTGGLWLAILIAFMGFQSLGALKIGAAQRKIDSAPRHAHLRCPFCNENPPQGNHWQCQCSARFDTFATNGTCPACGRLFDTTYCPTCGRTSPIFQWYAQTGFPISVAPGDNGNHAVKPDQSFEKFPT